jgi:hypothetical protein
MPKYRVTFIEAVEVEADSDREAQSVAEELVSFGLGGPAVTKDVEVERV